MLCCKIPSWPVYCWHWGQITGKISGIIITVFIGLTDIFITRIFPRFCKLRKNAKLRLLKISLGITCKTIEQGAFTTASYSYAVVIGNLQNAFTRCIYNTFSLSIQAPVVQKADNSIHRINHYPEDSVPCFAVSFIHRIATYPVPFEQPGPGVQNWIELLRVSSWPPKND